MNPFEKLIDLSQMFVGVVETGDNDGPLIRLFQEAVDGKANKESWCCAFVQFLLKQVDSEMLSVKKNWQVSRLARTESCIKMWDFTPMTCRELTPSPGLIVVWRHWAEFNKEMRWVPTSLGHTGIVLSVSDDGTMETIEGNTSVDSGAEIVRNGDGVFIKKRHQHVDTGAMRTLGFLKPWDYNGGDNV